MKMFLNWAGVLVLLVLLAGNALVTHGQSWETILTVLPPADPPYPDRSPGAIFQNPFGSPESGNSRLIVFMRSDDHAFYQINLPDGTSQSQSLPYSPIVKRLVQEPVSGSSFALSFGSWQVHRSSDRGVSWMLVDSFADGAYASASGLAVDDAGNIFVSGSTNLGIGTPTWFVRKSSDHGLTWSTVDRLSNASSVGILFVPGSQGGLFVAGSRWTVRRSRDAGATWQQVDSFIRPGKDTYAQAMASDARGRIYVAGQSTPDPSRWDVRVSENGGSTWATISPATATAQLNGNLEAMVVDLAGNLFLAGVLDAWAVARRNADGVWHDIEFPFGTEAGWVPSGARAITLDRVGNAYVAGTVRLGGFDDVRRSMLVQRLLSDTPVLGITVSGPSADLFWPAGATDYILEAATSLPTVSWTTVTNTPTITTTERSVQLPLTGPAQFFRLRKP